MGWDARSRNQEDLEAALEAARETVRQAEARLEAAKAGLVLHEQEQPRIEALRDLVRALEGLREQTGECPLFGGPIDPARYDRLLENHRPAIEAFDEAGPRLRQARGDAEVEWRAASTEVEEVQARLEKERERFRREEREQRRRELIERARALAESDAQPWRSMDVSWSGRSEDDYRYRRLALLVLLWTIFLSMLVPMFHLPQQELAEEEIPERMAQLVVERQQEPEPEPQEVVEEQPVEEEPEEEPEPEPEPEIAEPQPEPREEEPAPVTTAEARERASQSGLLALSDDLEELASESVTDKLGNEADITEEGSEATEVSRDIVTAEARQASGGIRSENFSRNVGGSGGSVGDRETSRVESGLATAAARSRREATDGRGRLGRTDEEIQIVFDRNKAALHRIYNRALRTDPTLQGKVTLKLTIEPSGRVSACEVVASELEAEDLERKLVQRVQLFDFGAKDVPPVTITYPIDFLPS